MQEGKLKNFSEKAEDFLKLLDRMDNYKQFCVKNLSDLDKSLSDLDHALELVSMDGVKMIKLTSKRKQILLERRTNKDELDRIDAIYSKIKDTQSFYGQLQAACNFDGNRNEKDWNFVQKGTIGKNEVAVCQSTGLTGKKQW